MTTTVVVIVLALSLPQIVTGAVLHDVTVINPTYESYYDKISATGKIEAVSQSNLTTQLPIVPKEVYVNLGDKVKVGDTIADIDFEQTKQAVLSLLSLYDIVPDELKSVLKSVKIDQQQLESMIPSTITADYTGVISTLNLTKGAVTQPTEEMATIANLDNLRAVLRIPEDYAGQVKAGQEVSLKVSALGQKKYKGTIQRLAPAAKETLVGTTKQTILDVYVGIEDEDNKLKSGYSTVGTVRLNDTEQVMTIPYSAIDQQDSGSEYVYLYEDGKAKMRVIVTGRELADSVEVVAGLDPNEWVIEDISKISHDGQYVNLNIK